jgi:hypothetical protein
MSPAYLTIEANVVNGLGKAGIELKKTKRVTTIK